MEECVAANTLEKLENRREMRLNDQKRQDLHCAAAADYCSSAIKIPDSKSKENEYNGAVSTDAAVSIISNSMQSRTQVITGSQSGKALCFEKVRSCQLKPQNVFYGNVRKMEESSSLEKFLKVFCNDDYIVQTIIDSGGSNLMLLIDSFDPEYCLPGSILDEVVSKNLLAKCSIVYGCSDENACKLAWGSGTELIRLARGDVQQEYSDILRHLNEVHASDRMVEFIIANCIEICTDIEITEILLKYFNKKVPITLTQMMETLVLTLMDEGVTSISALPSRKFSKLLCLCKLAYLTRDDSETGFNFQDVSRCMTLDVYNGAFSGMINAGLGLLVYPKSAEKNAVGICKFIHPLVQQFLAAIFIASEPLLCQVNIFKQNPFLSTPKYRKLCLFYFGMGELLKNCTFGNQHLKSEMGYVYHSLLGTINLRVPFDESLADNGSVFFVYKLLHESQDPDLIRKCFSKRHKDLVLTINTASLPESLVVAICYVISSSGISDWSVKTHKDMKNTADFISLLVRNNSSRKIKVQTHVSNERQFIACPSSNGLKNGKPHGSDCIYVKCLREILHRILQLYSPIKIKSSSNESSYVSFLACDCLKKKFEENQLVTFEPIQAFHWLKSSVVQQKSKKHGSKSSRDIQEFQEHMSRLHDNEQVELVIMVSPLPERLYYTEPRSTVKRCIELYRENPGLFHKNAMVERSDGTFLNYSEYVDLETAVPIETTRKESRFLSRSSMMVVPRLPIPKSNLDSVFDQEPTPRIFDAQTYEINTQTYEVNAKGLPELKDTNKKEIGYEDSGFGSQMKSKPSSRSEVKVVKPLGVKGVVEYNVVGTETVVTQESNNSRAQIQRQVAVEAGTVLYSTMPNVFTVDIRYPCPEESRLIKKGGNGAIYSATYGHYEFAVKKTPYRSREIEIHKMLKHPNIVELKCLMFGHQQPEHKRRYFSYHFMSKYSGDLSRMVTNKPELTMVTLSEKYKGNPRLLGSMQGNWKYILKEMLKGLGFIHARNIIHRDMKASNILIKMFCECENLLTCTCTYKYSVCIADFDAAVTLDSNGSIPPMPIPNHNRLPPSQRNIYQVVPVGTDGYRAPESAQMIISNDLSILDPPLTVKADIWSVGLLMIRMLNGANGPTRQQKVSDLTLLGYLPILLKLLLFYRASYLQIIMHGSLHFYICKQIIIFIICCASL